MQGSRHAEENWPNRANVGFVLEENLVFLINIPLSSCLLIWEARLIQAGEY
jgi:hypothetical protein